MEFIKYKFWGSSNTYLGAISIGPFVDTGMRPSTKVPVLVATSLIGCAVPPFRMAVGAAAVGMTPLTDRFPFTFTESSTSRICFATGGCTSDWSTVTNCAAEGVSMRELAALLRLRAGYRMEENQ